MKTKNVKSKSKIKKKSETKSFFHFDSSRFFCKKPKIIATVSKHLPKRKRLLLLCFIAGFIIFIACSYIFWREPISWAVRNSLSQNITYPYATVLDVNVGNLSPYQLDKKLFEIKSNFESKKITFTNNESQWEFAYSELGVSFDSEATKEKILEINEYSLKDKYRLLIGSIDADIAPTISTENDKCIGSLSKISIQESAPQNAQIYFDNEIKIKPEQSGAIYHPASNCNNLSSLLATNESKTKVNLDIVPASLTEIDLEKVLPQIQSLAGESLTLYSNTYKRTLNSKQLLDLMDISENGSNIEVSWSSAKLDELISDIASKVNTYDSSPILGSCEYLISSGGYRLNKTATKNFILNLSSGSSRSYALPLSYQEGLVGKRSPVSPGTKGTVYLTFDDGLIYGNQIMNYASCYGVKVTFFAIGSRAGIDSAALRRAIAEGHAVQSHAYEHAATNYSEHSYEWQYNDIAQSITAIMNVTGIRPTYFRPPGGNRNDDTYRAASNNGVKLILWGATSADTAGVGSSAICSNVLRGAFPGASILMHASKQTTANAVPCIIEGLAARGYNMKALR